MITHGAKLRCLGCVQFRIFQHPCVDQIAELRLVGGGQLFEIFPVEYLTIADRPLGGQIEHVQRGIRTDRQLQPAVVRRAGTAADDQFVAKTGPAPAAITVHRLVLKTRKIVWQPLKARFDMLGKRQANLRMPSAIFFLGPSLGRGLAREELTALLAALDRLAKSLVEAHERTALLVSGAFYHKRDEDALDDVR